MFLPFPKHKPVESDKTYIVIEEHSHKHYFYAFAYYDGKRFFTGNNVNIVAFLQSPAISEFNNARKR